jgi:hypothetical protein
MRFRTIALMLLPALLAACAGAAPTSTPTAELQPTQVPPTSTSMPATATPEPTETPVPRPGMGITRSEAAKAMWGFEWELTEDAGGDELYAGVSDDGLRHVYITGPSEDIWSIETAIEMQRSAPKAEQDRGTIALMNVFSAVGIPMEEGMAWVKPNWKEGDYQTELYGKVVVMHIVSGNELIFFQLGIAPPEGLEALLESVAETR